MPAVQRSTEFDRDDPEEVDLRSSTHPDMSGTDRWIIEDLMTWPIQVLMTVAIFIGHKVSQVYEEGLPIPSRLADLFPEQSRYEVRRYVPLPQLNPAMLSRSGGLDDTVLCTCLFNYLQRNECTNGSAVKWKQVKEEYVSYEGISFPATVMKSRFRELKDRAQRDLGAEVPDEEWLSKCCVWEVAGYRFRPLEGTVDFKVDRVPRWMNRNKVISAVFIFLGCYCTAVKI